MKKEIITKILLLLFLMLTFLNANPFVEINIEKDQFLKYEPVYLEINFNVNALPEAYYMSGLRDSRAMIGLVIVDPSGNSINYLPPMKLFTMITNDITFFETLLISRNDFLFSQTGCYTLFLVDKKNNQQVSNKLNIIIKDVTNADDLEMQQKIEKNPIDYAMFVDLEGGDQFAHGKEIIDEMYIRKTSYHNIAASLLTINSSQIKYDWKSNKIERDKDIKAVEKFFPYLDENNYLPKYLKLQMATIIIDQFKEKDLSEKLKTKIKNVGKRYSKEIKQNNRYRLLESFSAN